MNQDLTVGNPRKVLWKFCIPLFGSILFQQMYNIADSLVAGKCIGENALAAVGNSYEITLIFLAFAFGCNIGCSVVVSRLFGEQKHADLKTAVHTAMITSGAVCLILMLTGLLGTSRLLRWIQTPENILSDSALYLNIYIGGLPFVFFYNLATGIFSALGDSKTPFAFLAVSSTANIAVDILFVKGFQMGVAGVAWATFLCQGISCVLSVLFVFLRLASLPMQEKPRAFSLPLFREFLRIAVPSVLQQSFISVGNIIIQGIINAFGAAVIAGYSAAVKLNNMVVTSFTTIGNGISNYTAQNLGAKKTERIRSGYRAGLGMVWLICLPLVLCYFFAGKYLIAFFMNNPSAEAIDTGVEFLRIVSPFYFIISAKLIADGILRGSGKMKQFMTATLTDLVLRVILAALLSGFFGTAGIWSAWPAGWSVSLVLSTLFYRRAYAPRKNGNPPDSPAV